MYTIVRDGSLGIFITMNEDEFFKQIRLAEQRRKAKHAGRFGMSEFRKMFGIRPTLLDKHFEIDKNYPISFDSSIQEFQGKHVRLYTLTYQTK